MTRHLESSAVARPSYLGESMTMPDDIEVMLAHQTPGDGDVVTAEQAAAGLLAELRSDPPYLLTHGTYRPIFARRHEAIEAAFDSMEGRRSRV